MKKIFLVSLLIAGITITAQVKTPQASPSSKIEQVVGLTTVEVNYSRPSAKGRTVYGDLVPYGKYWRTGANENTTVTFSEDVKIGTGELKKGKYALFTLPKADSWDVIFYSDTNNWGLPQEWDDKKVALRVTVKPETLNKSVESFTISLNNLTNDSGALQISWERTIVSVPFTVPTQEITISNIERVLAGPSAADYFSASKYYFESDKELNKSLTWVNKAIEMVVAEGKAAPFWYLRLKSLVQAKSGDKKGAIATAKLSLEGAIKAGNKDYEKMNNDSIAEWSK
jgi:hypothetical protein